MTEQDYQLLQHIQSQPLKRIIRFSPLPFPSSIPAACERIKKLRKKGYVRETDYYIYILAEGEMVLEDYLLEQQRQQPHHKSVLTKENIMFVFKLLSCVFAIAAAIKEMFF